jgi:hypothetical protein
MYSNHILDCGKVNSGICIGPCRTCQRLRVELRGRAILPDLGPAGCEQIELGELGRACGIRNRSFANAGKARKDFIISVRAKSGCDFFVLKRFACAGKDKATGEVLKSWTMLITEPNDFVSEVHARTPVVLESKDFASWLSDGGAAMLRPAANDVPQRWPVSRLTNSSKAPADDPTLIEWIEVKCRPHFCGPRLQGRDMHSTGTGNG